MVLVSPYQPRDIAAELHIRLPDVRLDDWAPDPIGGRLRHATATSVRFLDAGTIVCCSQLARKIYLIRFDLDAGRHEILDQADTMSGGETVRTGLCDIDGYGHVVTSNRGTGGTDGMSLYHCKDDRIAFVRDLPAGNGASCHGVAFLNRNTVAAAIDGAKPGASFYDLNSMRRLFHIDTASRARDVCFLSDTRCIVLTAEGDPTQQAQALNASAALLVEFDLGARTSRVVREAPFHGGQIDAGVVRANRLYAVDSGRGTVHLRDAKILAPIREIGGYNFPHGIDVGYGLMAVTSYGDNSVDVAALPR